VGLVFIQGDASAADVDPSADVNASADVDASPYGEPDPSAHRV
jgi:hypothetical protein